MDAERRQTTATETNIFAMIAGVLIEFLFAELCILLHWETTVKKDFGHEAFGDI
jgi:hypothetical protein